MYYYQGQQSFLSKPEEIIFKVQCRISHVHVHDWKSDCLNVAFYDYGLYMYVHIQCSCNNNKSYNLQ